MTQFWIVLWGVVAHGIACLKTGRKFIGCEVDERYYGVAVERIKEIQPP